MHNCIAIGDVHGCAILLDQLMAKITIAEEDTVVFLGDYVDRGPDSPGVIERLIRFKQQHRLTFFLRGNHDAMLLSFLGLATEGHGDSYLMPENGGVSTLIQYGCAVRDLSICDRGFDTVAAQAALSRIKQRIPQTHIDFLLSTTLYYNGIAGYLFVHAGVAPGKPMRRQTQDDLLWIRSDFINAPHQFPQTIVYGHSVTYDTDFLPRFDDAERKIGVDTGAVYGGFLTALMLPDRTFVSVPEQPPIVA